jgi:hypothetical protein
VSEQEVILRVGAEGGDITLHGVRTENGWRFQRKVVDQTACMLDEEEIRHDSLFTSSWDEALALLDRYPWRRLYPLEVHPEFQQAVWRALPTSDASEHAKHNLRRWQMRCGITTQL